MMRIAMVGTRGVPARYGGFETCVEEVGRRLVERGHDVRVYCRGEQDAGPSFLGMNLVHLPALRRKSLETLSHTALSAGHLVVHRTDVALVFNAANAPFLPMLRARRIPFATHVDGLEWQRAKWGGNGRRYYRRAESLAVRWSDALIADAQGIADYYTAEFGAETELIAYGAPVLTDTGSGRLAELGLTERGYHLVVARFEPENHVAEIVAGYTAEIEASADDRVRLLGGVWDQGLLDELYANCLTYLHGHSVGGTNPSLLRAIGAGAATIAWDVSFNREVLGDSGDYFGDPSTAARAIEAAELDRAATARRGQAAQRRAALYDWDDVAVRYEKLCQRLADGHSVRSQATGRRQTPSDGSTVPSSEKAHR
jgi:glycosyltransferase involved in cell wall biosynthesis